MSNEPREIHHIVNAETWRKACEAGEYAPDSLKDEGFIHFSTTDQVSRTLARYYEGVENLLLVTYEADCFGDNLVFEATVSDEVFPHIYCAIDPAAARSVESIDRS